MVQLKINTQIKEYPDDITWQVRQMSIRKVFR